MIEKNRENRILYLLLAIGFLCTATIIRAVIKHKFQMDEFTALITFIVVMLIIIISYLCFLSSINKFLLPLIDKVFSSHIKKHEEKEEILEEIIIEKAEAPAPAEIITSQYNISNQVAEAKQINKNIETFDKVIDYTIKELSPYINEKDIKSLCEFITLFQYANIEECSKIKSTIKVSDKLRPIDLMHFGWNIANQFKKSGIETATFLKKVFAHALKENEISTIKQKLRADGTCVIRILEKL